MTVQSAMTLMRFIVTERTNVRGEFIHYSRCVRIGIITPMELGCYTFKGLKFNILFDLKSFSTQKLPYFSGSK